VFAGLFFFGGLSPSDGRKRNLTFGSSLRNTIRFFRTVYNPRFMRWVSGQGSCITRNDGSKLSVKEEAQEMPHLKFLAPANIFKCSKTRSFLSLRAGRTETDS
jgi:hypothetical protein